MMTKDNDSDLEYSVYRRPTVIYNVDTYEIIKLGEYEEINKIYKQYICNCQQFGLYENANSISTFEILPSLTEENPIILDEEFLKKYINKTIEKFLNSIIGNDHRE